jgi:hypothetical protein
VVLVAPSVTPTPLRLRTRPRSTVRLPVHAVEHHWVDPSPSIALAGEPAAAVEAVAVPVTATLSATRGGASNSRWALPVLCRALAVPASASALASAATDAHATIRAARRVIVRNRPPI